MQIMNNLFMQKVIEDAQTVKNDIPVSALIVKNDEIICICHNQKEEKQNATYHAEILAIEQASKILNSWRLDECDMYVTLEPCPMCAGAILMSGIDCVYFGAYEEKFGAVGSKFNLFYDFKFNHRVNFRGGIMEEECAALMKDFFEELR